MEQTTNQNATTGMVSGGAQKNKTGLVAGMVACAVIATLGIGFGVYGIMRSSQKDSQISDLKVKIKEDDGTVTTIETPKVETTDEGITVTIPEDIATISDGIISVDPSKYLYVSDWGIKIAIPDTLRTVNYTYSAQNTLCLSGVKYHENGMHYFPEFADITKNTPGLACVSRTLKDGYSYGDPSIEAYEYMVQGSQALYDASDKDWEVESVQEAQKMLDTANFSKISEDADPSKYLYIGDWGIKIAIPDSLRTVNYTYSARDTLCLSGVKYHENGMHYFPEFADITKNTPGLACVSRTLKDGHSDGESPLEAYEYTVQGPQALYDMNDKDWEIESVQEVQKMLDTTNFSRI